MKVTDQGYGSAKTSTCGAEFISLAIGTPNGRGLVGAQTYPQLDQTCKKQVIDMLPKELIAYFNESKGVMILTNGYEILFRSFDDEQKLRSLNLCHAWIEEANGTSLEVFSQLQTRLRHHATNNHKILMSTNPDGNWIKTDILLRAGKIVGTDVRYPRKRSDVDPNISVHIAKTALNKYLPRTYIDDLRANKPDWWQRRYLDGSFENAEGRVYPNFESAIVDDITYDDIVYNVKNRGWRVLGMADFGIKDPTVLLLAAIDPKEGIVYVYDEYYRNDVAVPTHAHEMKNRLKHVPLGSLTQIVADPSGAKRSISDMKSLFSHYAEYGIYFQKGDNRIDAGIQKVYSYLEMGRLKVLAHLEHTIEEHVNYMYKPIELGEKVDEKPIDKDNHTVDSLRYGIQTLPDDPMNLMTETFGMHDFLNRPGEEPKALPPQLQEDEDTYSNANDWYNYY